MPRSIMPAMLTSLACLVVAGAVGCRNAVKERASIGFHAEGVRQSVKSLRREVNRDPPDLLNLAPACDHVTDSLKALPDKVEREAPPRMAERKAAAEKAKQLFAELRPKLQSLNFDRAAMHAKLDELVKLLDDVERD